MSDELPPEADKHPLAQHPRMASSLFGQQSAEASFLQAVGSGRLHHAWLVSGPRGVGKATLAWRIARYLLAGSRRQTLELDPSTNLFQQTKALVFPGLLLCRRAWDPRAKKLKKEITIEDVRTLKASLLLSAPDGGARVVIIDSVDDMNFAAANALLKVLEEPPDRTILLLVSHRPAGLLPTIRSRCRVLRCNPLSETDLKMALAAANHRPTDDEFSSLSILSRGSVSAAIDLASGQGVAVYSELTKLMTTMPSLERSKALRLADSCRGTENLENTRLMVRLLETALARVASAGADAPSRLVCESEAALFARFGRCLPQAQIWADNAATIVGDAESAIAVNLDPAQVMFDTFHKLNRVAADALSVVD